MKASKDIISGKRYAPKNLGKVLVLGCGKTGAAVLDYCLSVNPDRIESITVAIDSVKGSCAKTLATYKEKGILVCSAADEITKQYNLCIASPGISPSSELFQKASSHSEELISEVEFAWRESDVKSSWIAITGTNGKTTTTSLINHILNKAGKDATAVGNIGNTCIHACKEFSEYYVTELSSYQLECIKLFSPEVAVLLNITPDHLTWHGSFEAYAQAKLNVVKNVKDKPSASLVYDFDNQETSERVNEFLDDNAACQVIAISVEDSLPKKPFVGIKDGMIVIEDNKAEYKLISEKELIIKGKHNVSNALAATAACYAIGLHPDEIAQGLRSFKALEHRIEPCGSVSGVDCYNDSKATNVDATLKALQAFDGIKPIVLLGGYDKYTDLTELVEAAEKYCKAVVCFGAAKERFYQAFATANVPSKKVDYLEDALDCSLSLAEKGDVVILSPACASFDEFSSFEQRGEVFKQLVQKRI